MLSQWEAAPKGAAALEGRLRLLLQQQGQVEDFDGSRRPITKADWYSIDQNNLLEDIIVRWRQLLK